MLSYLVDRNQQQPQPPPPPTPPVAHATVADSSVDDASVARATAAAARRIDALLGHAELASSLSVARPAPTSTSLASLAQHIAAAERRARELTTLAERAVRRRPHLARLLDAFECIRALVGSVGAQPAAAAWTDR